MNEPKFTEPIFNEQSIILPEHKSNNILARKFYLVICFRQDETWPFGYQILQGQVIALNDLPEYYRYYLLPEKPKEEATV